MENIEIGIWTVYNDGIKCKQPHKTKGWISKSDIWATTMDGDDEVWDLPIHIARKTWSTKKDVNDLLEAMAIHRIQFPFLPGLKNKEELDRKTNSIADAIIDHRNNCDAA